MRHTNEGERAECKRQLAYVTRGRRNAAPFTDFQCLRQVKRWVLAGLDIPSGALDGKTLHFAIDIATVGAQSEPEELDLPPAHVG